MCNKYSEAEAQEIIGQAYATLQRDGASPPTNISAPEPPTPTIEEIMAMPCESANQCCRRKIAERDARWAEERRQREAAKAEAAGALEARIDAKLASLRIGLREFVFQAIDEAVKVICEEENARNERQRAKDNPNVLDLPNVLSVRRPLQ